MKRYIIVLLCLSLWVWTAAGAELVPQKLASEGPMPKVLEQLLDNSSSRKDYDTYLHRLLLDGDVIYGTKINQYVNGVADRLLADSAQLRGEISIFLVKNSTVNAMMSEHGILLLNLGLLAQLSNESELAFILAHEMGHYSLKHRWEKSKKRDKSLSTFLRKHNRSRENEMAADAYALKLLSQSPYSTDSYDGAFDVLLYNTFPYDEVPFTRAEVDQDFYQFPEDYFLAEVSPIEVRENYVDTLSTHPNIGRRREECRALAKSYSGGAVWVESSEKFHQMQYLARCGCLNIDLVGHNYLKSLYNSFVMLQQYPNDPYLQLVNAYSYYGMAKHKNHKGISDINGNYKKMMGEQQQLSYFLRKIKTDELTTLALRKCYALQQQYPTNDFVQELTKSLISDLVQKHNLNYSSYLATGMGVVTAPVAEASAEREDDASVADDAQSSKYKKIKKDKKKTRSNSATTRKSSIVNYMLVDYMNDANLQALFAATPLKEEVAILDIVNWNSIKEIDNLYVMKPFVNQAYLKHKGRVKSNERYAQKSWRKTMRYAQSMNLNLPGMYRQEEDALTSSYNQSAKMSDWSYDLSQSMVCKMVPFESFGMERYVDLSKNSYLVLITMWMDRGSDYSGNVLERTKLIWSIPASILYPYFLPISVGLATIPSNSSGATFYLIDPATGKVVYRKRDTFVSNQSKAYVDAFIYDCLYELKKGGKQ